MADKKISQLTTLAQADVAVTADFLPIVDTSATETKKATPQSVVLGALGATSANVGIGTASPGSKLHVLGSAQVSVTSGYNELGLNGTYASASARVGAFRKNYDSPFDFNVYASVGSSGNAGAMIFWRDSANENARFDTSGNLGIGTASPSYRLDVARASFGVTSAFRSSDGVNNPRIIFYGSATESTIQATSSSGASTLSLATSGAEGSGTVNLQIDADRNVTVGGGTLATTATDGFLYVPTCAGTPTGTPTAKTGYAPIVVNTTNNKLYFYSGGAWRDAGP